MTTIFAKLAYELEKQHSVMLVTIMSQNGSTPRGTGAQMLVGASGHIIGTIGGGAVEQLSGQMAQKLLQEKTSGRHSFLLHQNASEDIGMVCGGDVSVWFQFIDAMDPAWPAFVAQLLSMLSSQQPGWFVQKLDGSMPALLNESGELVAGWPAETLELGDTQACILTETCFAMPLQTREHAVLFGGGHCTQALVPILRHIGFRVTVMDNRPEFAVPELFPEADVVLCGDYLKIDDYLKLEASDYVVIMTSGHSHDLEIQAQVLQKPLAYVGVIGSRSKKAFVNERLKELGIPEEAIHLVHTPIGIHIKAVTPEEIAVSIAGEMIYERAIRRERYGVQKHGCPMR